MSKSRVSRRQFLNYTLTGVGGFMAAGMLMPMVRFAVDPALKSKSAGNYVPTEVKAADLSETPIKVDFTFEQIDAWYRSDVTNMAWVYKEGDEIVALSPVCKHLGCTVGWATNEAHPDEFFCKCHDGRYEKTGENIPGTPPMGPLDQYEIQVNDDGFLEIGPAVPNMLVKK